MNNEAFRLGFMNKLAAYDVDYEIDAYGADASGRYLGAAGLAAITALLHAKGYGASKYVTGGGAALSALGGYAAELELHNNRMARDAIVGGSDEAMELLLQERPRYLPDALYYKDEHKKKFVQNMEAMNSRNPELYNKAMGVIKSYYPNYKLASLDDEQEPQEDPYKWHKRIAGITAGTAAVYGMLRSGKAKHLKNLMGNLKRAKSWANDESAAYVRHNIRSGKPGNLLRPNSYSRKVVKEILRKAKEVRDSNVVSAMFK